MIGTAKGKRFEPRLDKLLLAAGLVLLGCYFASRFYTSVASHLAIVAFNNRSSAGTRLAYRSNAAAELTPDFSLWSPKRIAAYRDALAMNFGDALAILKIPKLHVEVPVFNGTSEDILNRGAGRIKGTGQPGASGNMAIAAHRDGYFRGLKYIQLGDRIDLLTREQNFTYVVDDIVIVAPTQVDVLQPRPRPSITLVTCYPFYFIGDAPQRYIVHASRAQLN